jgi:hypothetical protein
MTLNTASKKKKKALKKYTDPSSTLIKRLADVRP